MNLLSLSLILAATLPPGTAPPAETVATSPVAARVVTGERVAWATPPPAPGAALFTLLDYFDAGQERALRYFGSLDSSVRDHFLLADVAAACVRVTCRREGGRSVVFATGVLVSGGRRVLTAGHAVGEAGDSTADISVILADGQEIPARVARRSATDAADEDWAVLELVGPVPRDLVSVTVASVRPGALAFILGYPERVGLGADGRAASALASQPVALDPLLFVARVPLSAEPELEPLAGAVPLSGASGSPVFDERGELVAVLVAVGRLAYPEGLRHVYRVSLSREFEGALSP